MLNYRAAKRSRGTVTVVLKSGLLPLRLRLLSSNNQTLAEGYDQLEVQVPRGLYFAEARGGANVKREIIEAAGERVEHVMELAIQTAAPLEGSTGYTEAAADAVTQLSEQLSQNTRSDQAGVLFFFRDNVPAEMALHCDSGLAPLDWTQGDGWTAATYAGEPGGFMARTLHDQCEVDTSLWLVRDWITMVFVPVVSGSARFDAASVLTHRSGENWLADPQDPRVRLHAEQALAALRAGRADPERGVMRTLRHYKRVDPMLGLLGATLRLLAADRAGSANKLKRAEKALDDVCFLVQRIERFVPGHPDIAALAQANRLMRQRFGFDAKPATDALAVPVDHPPMLGLLNSVLRSVESHGDTATRADSLAEHISGEVLERGPWTTWWALGDIATGDSYGNTMMQQRIMPSARMAEIDAEFAQIEAELIPQQASPSTMSRSGASKKTRGKARKTTGKARRKSRSQQTIEGYVDLMDRWTKMGGQRTNQDGLTIDDLEGTLDAIAAGTRLPRSVVDALAASINDKDTP